MSAPRMYGPIPAAPVEAMRWDGDWDAVSMWVYGEVLNLEVDADDDDPDCGDRPVVRDGCGNLSVLDVEVGERICVRGDYLVKSPHGWAVFDGADFEAIYR